MSMVIGRTSSNIDRKRIVLKNRDGSYAGSISVSKSKQKKKKRLNYNFKRISTLILQTKTSGSARQVVSKAHTQLALLLRKNTASTDSEYDATELRHAIIHARKMERIARKRMKHLQQEEHIRQNQKTYLPEFEEEIQDAAMEESDEEEAVMEMSEEELQQLMEELQETMQEAEEEWTDSEIKYELTEIALEHMDAGDLEKLKKKHRSQELREILEADMKYLKAMFEKMERERQNAASGSTGRSDNAAGTSSSQSAAAAPVQSVSLQIGGAEMPVDIAEAPVTAEGANFDAVV